VWLGGKDCEGSNKCGVKFRRKGDAGWFYNQLLTLSPLDPD